MQIRKTLSSGTAAATTVLSALLGGAPAGAVPETYQIDRDHTFVTFEVVHFNTSTVRGRFNEIDGTITLDSEARAGRVDIEVDTTSIDSGVAEFDKHLKSSDFLAVDRFPRARFTSDTMTFKDDKPQTISGVLTLLGRTLPVTLNAVRFNCYFQPVLKADMCGGDFETTIIRSQWGMSWGVDMGIPDRVRLVIQIEASKN